MINSGNRTIGRNLNYVHSVDVTELLLLGKCRTCHTGLLLKLVEEVLEGDGCKSFALVLNINIFLCFDCLVQTFVVASAEHYSAREFVNDENLIILNNIVNIALHNSVCADCLIYVVEQGHIFCVHQVDDVKVLFSLSNAVSCNGSGLCLFVNDVVGVYIVLLFLSVNLYYLICSHSSCKLVCSLVKVGGLIASARNDKRSSRFIDKDRVNLVHNGKVHFSLNLILLPDAHIVTKVVEAVLVICTVGYIAVISFSSLFVILFVNDKANGKTKEAVNTPDKLAVTLCKIIVNGYNVNALACKCIKVGGQSRNIGFTFACFHFCNSTLMQNNTADNLNGEMLQAEHAPRSLAAGGKRFGENIVKRFAVCKAGFEFGRFCLKLLIGQL